MALDGFKTKHLKMIVALSEHGKIGTVASMFGVSQPAMSRTIFELEQMAGHKLFERHSRGMTPTHQGEIVVRHARMVIEDTRRVEYEMRSAAVGKGGSVAFGTVMTPASDYVAPVLKRVFERNPSLDVHISLQASDILLEQVVSRRLDFAVCRIPAGTDALAFEYFPLGHETLRLVVGTHHPLAVKSAVTENDLAEQNWVLQDRGSVLRSIVDNFHQKKGIHPGSVISTSSFLLTILLVVQTERVGIFAETVAKLLDTHGVLRALPIEANLTVPEFGIIKLKDRELSASAQSVFDSFRSYRAEELAREKF